MKLMCVNNKLPEFIDLSYKFMPHGFIDGYPPKKYIDYINITIGKVYDEYDHSKKYYYITDDTGGKYWYLKSMFLTLDEWRSKQIEGVL